MRKTKNGKRKGKRKGTGKEGAHPFSGVKTPPQSGSWAVFNFGADLKGERERKWGSFRNREEVAIRGSFTSCNWLLQAREGSVPAIQVFTPPGGKAEVNEAASKVSNLKFDAAMRYCNVRRR